MNEHLTELEYIANQIEQAEFPEQIFGNLTDEKQGYSVYRQLAKLTHPDLYPDPISNALAQSAFRRLSQFWDAALQKLRNGTDLDVSEEYETIIIQHRKKEYIVTTQLFQGEIYNFYPCTYFDGPAEQTGVFKINQDPIHNDLLKNEAQVLKQLSDSPNFEKHQAYFPKLIDSFPYIDPSDAQPRQVNILAQRDGFFSLRQVRESYTTGIDPKDMAWIFRRLLFGLGFAHKNNIIHGAVLPQHIFIHPEKHGLIIAEWSNALIAETPSTIPIEPITNSFLEIYPKKVRDAKELSFDEKETHTPGLDIYMSAKLMSYILGADTNTWNPPNIVPKKIKTFLLGTALENPNSRPQDAWQLLEEFDNLLESIWGPKKYHPFSMPKKANKISFW